MKGKQEMIAAMLIFGSIGIFVKNIDLPSLEIAFLRATIGGIFLICFGFIKQHSVPIETVLENAPQLILSGIALGFNWVCLFNAYKYASVSLGTLSYYFAPIFIILLSSKVLKEELSRAKFVCIIVAMLGLVLILCTSDTGMNLAPGHAKGIFYGLLGAALYACVIIMNKLIKGLSGFITSTIELNISALVLLSVFLYKGGLHLVDMGLKSIMLIFVLGIFHTGIAYYLYFTAVKQLRGQSIAFLSYIDPISALAFAQIFLKEAMTFPQIVGGMFILGAAFFNEIT